MVDETRRTGGISEGVLAALVDAGFDGRMARVDEQGLASSRSATPRSLVLRLRGRDRGRGARAGLRPTRSAQVVETAPCAAVVIYESLTGNTRRAAEIIGRELRRRGVPTTVCNITAIDLQALSEADLVVVGSWTDGHVLLRSAARAGVGGSRTGSRPCGASGPSRSSPSRSSLARRSTSSATSCAPPGADVIGGMAIRRDDLEGGAKDLVDRLLDGRAPRRPERRALRPGARRRLRRRRRCPSAPACPGQEIAADGLRRPGARASATVGAERR